MSLFFIWLSVPAWTSSQEASEELNVNFCFFLPRHVSRLQLLNNCLVLTQDRKKSVLFRHLWGSKVLFNCSQASFMDYSWRWNHQELLVPRSCFKFLENPEPGSKNFCYFVVLKLLPWPLTQGSLSILSSLYIASIDSSFSSAPRSCRWVGGETRAWPWLTPDAGAARGDVLSFPTCHWRNTSTHAAPSSMQTGGASGTTGVCDRLVGLTTWC